jgi:ABC-type sulfate/molybdate transport systems ATPase subunit
MITHDPEDIEWFGERTLYLREGGISEVDGDATGNKRG